MTFQRGVTHTAVAVGRVGNNFRIQRDGFIPWDHGPLAPPAPGRCGLPRTGGTGCDPGEAVQVGDALLVPIEPDTGLDDIGGGSITFPIQSVSCNDGLAGAVGAHWAVVAHFDSVVDFVFGVVGGVREYCVVFTWRPHTTNVTSKCYLKQRVIAGHSNTSAIHASMTGLSHSRWPRLPRRCRHCGICPPRNQLRILFSEYPIRLAM